MLSSTTAPTARTPLEIREMQTAARSSLAAAALLAVLKLTVGLLTGSLGILSEAAHSMLDTIAALVTYVSVRLSARPADASHPFGHGKFEHLSAFIETGLLLVTCAWIVIEAVRRLVYNDVHVRPSIAAFVVMAVSIAVDTLRSRSLGRVARRSGNQALEADALHFSTDIYGSSVVIVGLAVIVAAHHWHISWLRVADPLAALFVAVVTVYISVRLGKRTVDALVDAAPAGTSARIARAISGVPGVVRQDRIRVRQSGSQLFVDLRLMLESNIPIERVQAVEDEVESRVRSMFPGVDIVIHSAPRQPSSSELIEKIRAVANRYNYSIHDVTPYEVGGRVNLSFDLELEPSLTLDAAHRRATELENEIKREIPQVKEVNIHIEPALERIERALEVDWLRERMEKKLMRIARNTPGLLDCHSVEAHQAGGNFVVSLHCTLEPELPLRRVHEITEELELQFRKEFPQIMKLNIHAEPRGQS